MKRIEYVIVQIGKEGRKDVKPFKNEVDAIKEIDELANGTYTIEKRIIISPKKKTE